MKVFLDGSVVRAPMSGVQFAVQQQLLALLAHAGGRDVTVFCLDPEVRAAVGAAQARAGPLPAGTRRVYARIFWQQVVLPRLLRRGDAAVLHALAYTAPLRCPVPYVLNVHDVIALERPDLCARLNVWHMRALLPASIRGAAANIVSSRHVGTRVSALLGVSASRLHHVPLGVDAETFAAPAPRPSGCGLHPERRYVLFLGNLEPKKGLDTLLDAYAASAARLDADLVLAGRPAWGARRLLQRIAAYNGPGRIYLPGRVPVAELPGLYQHAWAFVFPSLCEGFGMPVLEAMAAGVPVIHSDYPALVETAGGAGLAFRRGDADDLQRRLVALHESATLHAALCERGRSHARTRSWAEWAAQASDIVAAVARGG